MPEVGWSDAERWDWLVSLGAHAEVVEDDGEVVAFLVGFAEGSAYDSPNYRSFEAWGRERGAVLCAEVNTVPPNRSLRFHQGVGPVAELEPWPDREPDHVVAMVEKTLTRRNGRTDRGSRAVLAPPARVFAALTDPDVLGAWLPPAGMSARFEHVDLRPGGAYRIVLTYDEAGEGAAAPGKAATWWRPGSSRWSRAGASCGPSTSSPTLPPSPAP